MATISHKNLSGTQLHENKGVSAASDGTVATASGGATVWQKLTATNLTGSGNPFGGQLLHVRDEKTSGTASQTIPTTTWTTRTLQTTKTGEIASASLASNQISLPAGTYFLAGYFAAGQNNSGVGAQKIRLRNITDSTTIVVSPSVHLGSVNGGFLITAGHTIPIQGRFTLAATKTLELQHYTQNACNAGLPVTSGEIEVYADVLIWKVA